MVYVWIALAGGAGSVCRYLVWRAISPAGGMFPYGTLAVNLAGCFLIGLLARMVTHDMLRLTLITGFLGGFTTFSAYGLETLQLFRNGYVTLAVWYLMGSNVGGLAAAWTGWRIGHPAD